MKTFRQLCLMVLIAAAAISARDASATIKGEAIYTEKFLVPAFVPDVRKLIVDAASVRGWKVIGDQPGELTFELRHIKSHTLVIAKAVYSKSEFSFHKVRVDTFDCGGLACNVHPEDIQRWMVSLRREAGVALLKLAILDAGGSLPAGRAPVAEPEEG